MQAGADKSQLPSAICELVTNGSVELGAASIDQVSAGAALLPFGTSVYVPSPADKPLDSNLDKVAALHEAGMEPVPHIVARKVLSRSELRQFVSRVTAEFGVHRVLVIGGDAEEASGPYTDSVSLLKDDVLAESGIHEVGVAGYPEGHPHIPPAKLQADFGKKLELVSAQGLGLEVVTQFTFVPSRIIEYCSTLAHEAPEVPVYVGMAGPASAAELIRFANYCGVSTSVRALSDFGAKAATLAEHTDPDEQLAALAHHCAVQPFSNVIGIHLYSFGGFERTARWMRNRCRSGG